MQIPFYRGFADVLNIHLVLVGYPDGPSSPSPKFGPLEPHLIARRLHQNVGDREGRQQGAEFEGWHLTA